MKTIIVHYHEIALKGRNRIFFERKLMDNLERIMSDLNVKGSVNRMGGRIRIETSSNDIVSLIERLSITPGIAYVAEVDGTSLAMEAIKKASWSALTDEEFSTFAVRTKRSNKQFEKNSHEVDVEIGSFLVDTLEENRGEHPEKYTDEIKTHYGWVDLENPDIILFVEIVEQSAFVYTSRERTEGIGGLPTSTAGKLVSLLSSGIDSPVASFCMMKRGAKIIFVHFHSYPYTKKESLIKVRDIVTVLSRSQIESILYEVPFGEIQQELVDAGHSRLRLLLYRRLFIRIAEAIAYKEGALGLVTGESVGQVASQTLENIRAVDAVATLPIYRPLAGMNKEEIIDEANKIGTFNIATREGGDDCCSLFLPAHPETRATVEELDAIENKFSVDEFVKKAVNGAERKEITS